MKELNNAHNIMFVEVDMGDQDLKWWKVHLLHQSNSIFPPIQT